MIADEKLEKCPLCERRIPASNLTTHIQNEHTGGGGLQMSHTAPASPTMDCKFCPSTFKDQMELHLHQINQHTVELLQQSQQIEKSEFCAWFILSRLSSRYRLGDGVVDKVNACIS